jgi:hypothetical protein
MMRVLRLADRQTNGMHLLVYFVRKAYILMSTMADEINSVFLEPEHPEYKNSIFYSIEKFLESKEAELKAEQCDDKKEARNEVQQAQQQAQENGQQPLPGMVNSNFDCNSDDETEASEDSIGDCLDDEDSPALPILAPVEDKLDDTV